MNTQYSRLKLLFVLSFVSIFSFAAVPPPVWHSDGQKTNNGIGTEVFIGRPNNVQAGDMIILIFSQNNNRCLNKWVYYT